MKAYLKAYNIEARAMACELVQSGGVLHAPTFGSMFVVSDAARGQSIVEAVTTVPRSAPIGHLQPRARQFAPSSTAEQDAQERMSSFDAQQ